MDNWKKIAVQLRQGNEAAYTEVYQLLYGRLFRFCFSYVRDHAVTENILQDSFLKLWQKKEDFDENLNVPAYLTVIVKNAALNYLQRSAAEQGVYADLLTNARLDLELRIGTLKNLDSEKIFTKELQALVQRAINRLPEQTRKILVLNRYDDKSYREIARLMNISEKGVEYHISKAFKQLRAILKNHFTTLFLLLGHIF
jgi:RNA polymerase sigma-70 factor, ECF subfamily